MAEQLTVGQEITLQAWGDACITRVLVAVENMHLYVCNRAEWEAALEEKREPSCVGFRMADLVQPSTQTVERRK
jgi:hypothetical protein